MATHDPQDSDGMAAPTSPDRDSGDVDIISDAAFTEPGSLSEQELRDLIDRFAARERVVSYERRLLHGRMDLLRAELVGRLRRRYRIPDPGDAA